MDKNQRNITGVEKGQKTGSTPWRQKVFSTNETEITKNTNVQTVIHHMHHINI